MATLYKIQVKQPIAHLENARPIKWASAEAGARKAKKELCEEYGLKATGADYEQVEVPTSKAGILEWLNSNVTK